MQNLKSKVFSIHSQLRPSLPFLKKTHLYELVAAFNGFKSYAAYKNSFNHQVDLAIDKETAGRLCFERGLSLGFNSSDAMTVSKVLSESFNSENRALGQFEKLYNFYIDTYYTTVSAANHIF
eukprot:TRINITY_DN15705_c0_g1_i1.p1 TRINITY_DN15705_c0_g1~~TRINITY_DN15705_c0_g1_i1.p1  ORF type:complete len:122 (+),score=15.26 TRINITY_DN15705_c0_g1_i1:690-1055(+)